MAVPLTAAQKKKRANQRKATLVESEAARNRQRFANVRMRAELKAEKRTNDLLKEILRGRSL